MRFTVQGQPVPKARPRLAPRGHTYTPHATREAELRVQQYCFANYPHLRPSEGRIRLTVEFHLRGAVRSDLDNLWKLVSDALNGIVWVDDRQIVSAAADVFTNATEPRTEIEAWAV